MKNIFLVIVLVLVGFYSYSQTYTAFYLDMNTNARIAGFGEVGVVSSPFYNNTGIYQNPALISTNRKSAGIDFSYIPWLENLVDDMFLTSTAGYFALDSSNAFAFNLTYFDYGNLAFADEYGELQSIGNPYEMYFKLGYSHSFNKSISAGIALRYFRSDIVPESYFDAHAVNSISADLGISYYKKYKLNKKSVLNTGAGVALTNLGPKVSYTNDSNKEFIPSKISLGLFINPDISLNNNFIFNIELGYQAEKYLVPTSPVRDAEGNVTDGYDTDISSFKALYQSFYDAPGGFEEEINEIIHKFGSEFRLGYKDYVFIAFRHGRHMEHESKGNRNYQTFGYGIGLFGFTVDYMKSKYNDNPFLDGTWAISFGITTNLGKEFFRF